MTAPKLHIEMINLARATLRRENMQLELAKAGVAAHFEPAFDISEHGEGALAPHCATDGPWGKLHPGNMACTLSHGLAWERFLASDADYCVVFEDDVFISTDMGAWLADMSWWPEDAQLVKLERWRGRSLKVLLDKDGPTHMDRQLRRMWSRHVGSAGYILNRAGAERMMAHRPFRLTIDNFLFNANASPAARGVTIYQVTPALVVQGNEPPDSQPSIPGRQKLTGLARWKQKLKRGYYEVAYPLPIIARYLTGQLQLEPVPYAAHAGAPTPKTET